MLSRKDVPIAEFLSSHRTISYRAATATARTGLICPRVVGQLKRSDIGPWVGTGHIINESFARELMKNGER